MDKELYIFFQEKYCEQDNVVRSRKRIISNLTEARLEKKVLQAKLASLIVT